MTRISFLATGRGFGKKIVLDDVLNSHNDMVGFYVIYHPQVSKYCISDDGNTLFDINPDKKEPTEDIKKILDKNGIDIFNGSLILFAESYELSEKESAFAKALTEIAGLK